MSSCWFALCFTMQELVEIGMLTLSSFIILSTFLGAINSFGSFPIDFTIDVQGGIFSWNEQLEPGAYERLLPRQKAKFFNEGTAKAERYCRQALGQRVKIEKEKNWVSRNQESARIYSVTHNVRIRCIRVLDLEEDDPYIGLYFDHARFLLSNLSCSKPAEENHQLLSSTLKILTQIGATAIPLLWDLHLQKIKNNEKSNFLATLQVIAQRDAYALVQIIDIIGQYQSKDRAYREDLLKLFSECSAKLEVRWQLVKAEATNIIRELIEESIVTYTFINNLTTIVYLFDFFHYWMTCQKRIKVLSEEEIMRFKRKIQRRIIYILDTIPEVGSLEELAGLPELYNVVLP